MAFHSAFKVWAAGLAVVVVAGLGVSARLRHVCARRPLTARALSHTELSATRGDDCTLCRKAYRCSDPLTIEVMPLVYKCSRCGEFNDTIWWRCCPYGEYTQCARGTSTPCGPYTRYEATAHTVTGACGECQLAQNGKWHRWPGLCGWLEYRSATAASDVCPP